MSRAEICLVSTWQATCGIADYVESLATELLARGHTLSVAAIDREELNTLSRRELAAHFTELGRRARGHRVLHVHHEFGFYSGAYGITESLRNFGALLEAATPGTGRVVVTFHSLPPVDGWRATHLRTAVRQTFLHRLWRTQVVAPLRRCRARVIAPSRYLRRHLIDSGIPAGMITVVPQGISTPALISDSERSAARALLGYEPDERVLALFGFVGQYKGHHIAAKALSVLPPQYRLVVVGATHPHSADLAYDRLLREAARPALRDRVRVLGHVDAGDARRVLAAADYCVAPYLDAGLATSAAITWAITAGRPIIATRIPPFVELNREAPAMALVTPDAPHELARVVTDLEADPRRRREMASAAALLAERHSWPATAARHAEVYGLGRTGAIETVGRRAVPVAEPATDPAGRPAIELRP